MMAEGAALAARRMVDYPDTGVHRDGGGGMSSGAGAFRYSFEKRIFKDVVAFGREHHARIAYMEGRMLGSRTWN
jgi:hypothetical protein